MGASGATPLVLIVDDDEGTRQSLAEVLDSAGLATIAAASGGAALDMTRDQQPSIAVLDHNLPDVRGTDLVAGLKEIDPGLPVLLVTGHASLDSAMRAVGQFDEYLVKPVPPERLIQAIGAALERRRLREENAALLERLRDANNRLASEMVAREQQLAGLVSFAIAESEAKTMMETIEAALRTVDDGLGLSPTAIYVASEDGDGELLLAGCRGHDWEPAICIPAPAEVIEAVELGSPRMPVNVIRIAAGGELIGALVVRRGVHGIEFLHALVAQLGLAMGNAQRLEHQYESVRRLTELARLRASLIGGVSHELRTPLTSLLGLAQTMRTRELPPELRTEFLDQILRQAKRLNVLVEDLLDETRLEAGNVRVDCTAVSLPTLLDNLGESFEHIPQTLHVECDLAVRPVLADPERLEQVLGNLLHNATKHTPPDSVLRLRASVVGTEVAISVADDGPGIDPAFLPRVFDAFAQGDSSDTGRDSGLGLGLAIARGFIEAMGGRIVAQSQPGRGSTFTVYLQVAEPAAEVDGVIPVPRPIDDEAPLRKLASGS